MQWYDARWTKQHAVEISLDHTTTDMATSLNFLDTKTHEQNTQKKHMIEIHRQDLVFSFKLQFHICLGLKVLESSSGRKQSQFLVLFVMPKARSLSKFSLAVSMVGVSVQLSIKVKSTPRPVVLTIESILDGDNCYQDKFCLYKCLCDSCPVFIFS